MFETALVRIYRNELPAERVCSACVQAQEANDHSRRAALQIDRSLIPTDYLGCTFANFVRRFGTEDAYRACVAWADSVRSRKRARGLLLHGPAGSGKTHLEVAALSLIVQTRLANCLFLNVPEWLNSLRTFAQTEDTPFPAAPRGYEVLVLDDLGAEEPGSIARDQIYSLVNHREAHGLPTLVSSNLDWGELERRFGGPTMSRLGRLCKPVSMQQVERDYRAILAEEMA